MAILGIRHVGDTVVGNEGLRGVSGGQRKRLTTAQGPAIQSFCLLLITYLSIPECSCSQPFFPRFKTIVFPTFLSHFRLTHLFSFL